MAAAPVLSMVIRTSMGLEIRRSIWRITHMSSTGRGATISG